MDKTTHCANHDILTCGGPGGTLGVPIPLVTSAQSVLLCVCTYPGRLQEVVLCWPHTVPEVAPGGDLQGCAIRKGSFLICPLCNEIGMPM